MPRSDVESTNLHMLIAIRLGIESDRIGASSRYALSAPLVDHLHGLGQDQLCAFVAHVGHNTLFPPRLDLLDLLQIPLPLTGPLAAVRPAQPVSSPPGIAILRSLAR